ncbi:MAG: hypothetical protein K0B07_04820 [DPANN group archaeon]|nr:hypothetical protein [DPANN group archaeon]
MDRKIKMCLYICLVLTAVVVCTQVYAVDLPTTIWMIAPEIQLDIRAVNVSLGDNQTFNVSIYNPNDYMTTGNFSIKVGYRTESGAYEYLEDNMIENLFALAIDANSTGFLTYDWSTEVKSLGTYKVYMRFDYNGTYTNRYTTFEIVAQQDEDTPTTNETTDTGADLDEGEQGGKEELEIISIYDNLDFGAISTIGVRYQSGPNSHGKLRVIGYISGPKMISQDLYENTIYRNFCNVNTGVEIRNVWKDSDFYINLPLLLKNNCESEYLPGNYSVTVRVCRYGDEGWEYYLDSKLKKKIDIWVKENKLCAKYQEPKETDMCKSLDNSPLGNKDIKEYNIKTKTEQALDAPKNKIYEVLEFDETVYVGDVFQTKIAIFNNYSVGKNVTIYSYVYDNMTLISDGLNGTVWSHNWNANKVVFELEPYSNYSVVLLNKIENVSSGLYQFRARMFYSGKQYDISRWISVQSRLDLDTLSVECGKLGTLGQVTITNKDSADIGIEYYVIDGDKWYYDAFTVKTKVHKSFEFSFISENVSVLVIGGGRDLYKCYISRENVNVEVNESSTPEITGYVSRDSGGREKIGIISWILGLFGKG